MHPPPPQPLLGFSLHWSMIYWCVKLSQVQLYIGCATSGHSRNLTVACLEMQSGEGVKLPSLGVTDTAVLKQKQRGKAKVRFLVSSTRHLVDVEDSLATETQHNDIETSGNIVNNETQLVDASRSHETPMNMALVGLQPAPSPKRSVPDMRKLSFERQAQEVIREKNEYLHTLAKEQDDLKNEVAMAEYVIMELKSRLAEVNYSLGSAKDHEESLRLEVGKLKHEKEKLRKRCENAVWERTHRLRAKDEKISSVQADTHRTLKLHDEVTKRNQDLKEKLEKREKVLLGLKTKVHLMGNWSVR